MNKIKANIEEQMLGYSRGTDIDFGPKLSTVDELIGWIKRKSKPECKGGSCCTFSPDSKTKPGSYSRKIGEDGCWTLKYVHHVGGSNRKPNLSYYDQKKYEI